MTIQLPPYPADAGPKAARQLAAARERYRKQIEAIQAELVKTEEAFAEAFAKADVSTNARERIAALAKNARATRR